MPTIQINIHPEASAKFDANATALLAFVGDRPQTRPAPPALLDDIETSEIPDKDIEDFRSEVRDGTGQVVERRFSASGKSYALSRDGCVAMATLAQRLCGNRELSAFVSRTFIENVILSWVIDKIKVPPVGDAFCEYFIRSAQEAVKKLRVWTPIANLVVQSPFRFGGATIQTLPATTVSGWESHALLKAPEEDREHVVGYFARVRKFFQGYAAFVSTIEAEPLRAEEYAYEEADRPSRY